VTLQTLHPNKFDHGQILAQSPFPGIDIPPHSDLEHLTEVLGLRGAELLGEALDGGVFVPPLQPLNLLADQIDKITGGREVAHAPKITPEDRRINWERMTSQEILHRNNVLGDLWDTSIYHKILLSTTPVSLPEHTSTKRIKFSGFHSGTMPQESLNSLSPGTPFLAHRSDDGTKRPEVGIKTVDGSIIVNGCTIAGEGKNQGEAELVRLMEKYGHPLVQI
jgi:methionyl-tRNA formyltransferase